MVIYVNASCERSLGLLKKELGEFEGQLGPRPVESLQVFANSAVYTTTDIF